MGDLKIIRGVFDTQLELEHANIVAGFPSPADDYIHETLDFNRDFIKHPEASFYGEVTGNSMIEAGIFNKDLVIIDRAVEARDGDIVAACINGEFTIKYLDLTHKKDGKGKADVFANVIKHDYKSPNPTTRWSDVIKLK